MQALLLSSLATLACGSTLAPTPNYPEQYTVSGIFKLPYANIAEPVRVVTDRVNERQTVSFYNGLDTFFYDLKNGNTYQSFIAQDTRKCTKSSRAESGVQPAQEHVVYPVKFLPDLADFEYVGQTPCPDDVTLSCYEWHRERIAGERTNTYTFVTRSDESFTPVLYTMVGYDEPFQSHYDLYEVHYTEFVPSINDAELAPPDGCAAAAADKTDAHHAQHQELGALFHGEDHAALGFKGFVARHARKYVDDAIEYAERQAIYRLNLAKINSLNRSGKGVTYKPNHLMDVHPDELRTHGKGWLPRADYFKSTASLHVTGSHSLPAAVDWRKAGFVTPVKDQGTCGSCWAFAATSAIESAWQLKYGVQHILSPQNLVDCAWRGYGNLGCAGGNEEPSFQWVIDHGGLMLEKDYAYLSQDSYCSFNQTLASVTLSGYVRIPFGDEEALKDAVAHVGPVSIAYDASHESMVFYSSGVYYEPECSATDLDHAVVIVGYGTTEDGEDYWIVKNSWSTYWGDMGYFKIARNRNNHCGIASAASYPVV